MKKLRLLILLMLNGYLTAQTIADVNFANAIRAACPTCIDGANVLLPPATTLTTLDVSGQMITDLTGIAGFTALQTLDCFSNTLNSSLPTLPNSLRALDCSNSGLSSMTLPSSLQILNCSANQFTTLPTLPSGLQDLNCSSNPFTTLPPLPSGLKILTCFGGQFTSLPTLPSTLQYLNCGDGKLTTLPSLPTTLQTLWFYNNKIASLTSLPTTLTSLICSNNLLTSLPILPTGLIRLGCGSNPLTILPTLPPTLQLLDCTNNQLTSLPPLPTTLKRLDCHTNQLTRLPTLPNALTILVIDKTLTCIPNQVAGLVIYDKDFNVLTRPTCATIGVELLNFEVKKKDKTNQLIWETASEVNNKGFSVERLASPKPPEGAFTTGAFAAWDILGFVNAKGKAAAYDFTDVAPPSGAGGAYYRLRQLDNDGKETLSKVVSVTRNSATKLKVYPNPVSHTLTVETEMKGNFQIFNLLVQQVLNSQAAQSIDVSALPQGAYFLKVGTEQVKFVKQ